MCAGAGGDFVLSGTLEYQPLHVDLNFPGCHGQHGQHGQPQAPASPPVVTLNLPLEPLTWENGPTKLPSIWQSFLKGSRLHLFTMVAAHFAFYFKASSEIWNLYQFLHCSSNPLECGELRRIIPGTHHVPAGHTLESWQPPESESEPDAWRRFTFCPVPAGPNLFQSSEMLKQRPLAFA